MQSWTLEHKNQQFTKWQGFCWIKTAVGVFFQVCVLLTYTVLIICTGIHCIAAAMQIDSAVFWGNIKVVGRRNENGNVDQSLPNNVCLQSGLFTLRNKTQRSSNWMRWQCGNELSPVASCGLSAACAVEVFVLRAGLAKVHQGRVGLKTGAPWRATKGIQNKNKMINGYQGKVCAVHCGRNSAQQTLPVTQGDCAT